MNEMEVLKMLEDVDPSIISWRTKQLALLKSTILSYLQSRNFDFFKVPLYNGITRDLFPGVSGASVDGTSYIHEVFMGHFQ